MPCVKRSRSRRSISASMPKVEHILIWVRSPAGWPDGPGSVGLRPFRLSGAGVLLGRGDGVALGADDHGRHLDRPEVLTDVPGLQADGGLALGHGPGRLQRAAA